MGQRSEVRTPTPPPPPPPVPPNMQLTQGTYLRANAHRYLKYLEETPAIYPFINVPVMTIFALPTAVVIFGVVKALTQ